MPETTMQLQSNPAQDEKILARLEVVEQMHPKPVWRLRDPETGKEYYAKLSGKAEAEMTVRAGKMEVPEGSILNVPHVLTADRSKAPASVREAMAKHTKHKGFFITEAVPEGASLSWLGWDAPEEAAQKFKQHPLTKEEYKQILDAVRKMNEAGVSNHDLLTNSRIIRGPDGKITLHVYDFDADTIPASYQNPPGVRGDYEDYYHIVESIKPMVEYGMLEADALELLDEHKAVKIKKGGELKTLEEQAREGGQLKHRETGHGVSEEIWREIDGKIEAKAKSMDRFFHPAFGPDNHKAMRHNENVSLADLRAEYEAKVPPEQLDDFRRAFNEHVAAIYSSDARKSKERGVLAPEMEAQKPAAKQAPEHHTIKDYQGDLLEPTTKQFGNYQRRSMNDYWLQFESRTSMEHDTGWKIHISATTKEAQAELARLAHEHGITSFKFATDISHAKDPGQQGKAAVFVHTEKTVDGRPIDWPKFIQQAEAIVAKHGGPGAAVHHDRLVPGSKSVYYRNERGAEGEQYIKARDIDSYAKKRGIPESQHYNLGGVDDPFANVALDGKGSLVDPADVKPPAVTRKTELSRVKAGDEISEGFSLDDDEPAVRSEASQTRSQGLSDSQWKDIESSLQTIARKWDQYSHINDPVALQKLNEIEKAQIEYIRKEHASMLPESERAEFNRAFDERLTKIYHNEHSRDAGHETHGRVKNGRGIAAPAAPEPVPQAPAAQDHTAPHAAEKPAASLRSSEPAAPAALEVPAPAAGNTPPPSTAYNEPTELNIAAPDEPVAHTPAPTAVEPTAPKPAAPVIEPHAQPHAQPHAATPHEAHATPKTAAPHVAASRKSSAGGNVGGLVADGVNIVRSVKDGNKEGTLASTGSAITNGAAATDDLLAAAGKTKGAVSGALSKAGMAATVATTGVELWRVNGEDSIDTKQLQSEAAASAAIGLGAGIAGTAAITAGATSIGLVGFGAGVVATGGGLLVAAAATAAVMGANHLANEALFGEESRRFNANLADKSSMIALANGKFHNELSDPKTGQVNWSDPAVYNRYASLLEREKDRLEKEIKAESSYAPNWMRGMVGSESLQKELSARSDLRIIEAAQAELKQLVKENTEFNNPKPKGVGNSPYKTMVGISGHYYDQLKDPKTGEINFNNVATLEKYETLLAADEERMKASKGMFQSADERLPEVQQARTELAARIKQQKDVDKINGLDINGDGRIDMRDLDRNKDGVLDGKDRGDIARALGGGPLANNFLIQLNRMGVQFGGEHVGEVSPASTPKSAMATSKGRN